MKKVLLIIGILLIIACVLLLVFALLYRHSYYNLFDGTPEHYKHLHQKMVTFFTAGGISALIGAVCVIIHTKIR